MVGDDSSISFSDKALPPSAKLVLFRNQFRRRGQPNESDFNPEEEDEENEEVDSESARYLIQRNSNSNRSSSHRQPRHSLAEFEKPTTSKNRKSMNNNNKGRGNVSEEDDELQSYEERVELQKYYERASPNNAKEDQLVTPEYLVSPTACLEVVKSILEVLSAQLSLPQDDQMILVGKCSQMKSVMEGYIYGGSDIEETIFAQMLDQFERLNQALNSNTNSTNSNSNSNNSIIATAPTTTVN